MREELHNYTEHKDIMEINVTVPEENEKRITKTDLKPALLRGRLSYLVGASSGC
jgi:hypothetical protein